MSFEKVSKRNGSIVDFDSNKIIEAIAKAGKATGEFEKPIASLITKVVLQKMELEQAIKNIEMFSIEQIQDIVEKVLLNTEYKDTAKAYMLYRDDRRKMREVVSTFHIDLISKYVDNDDWRIKENSNTTYSLQGLHNYMSSKLSTQYWLNHVYPTHISNAHNSGAFHIHDLSILAPYCCGWDLQDLLLLGFTGVPSKISSKPAKHLRTALGQLVNFTFTVQGEVAGAQAVSNFDTLLAPFVYYDNLNYTQVKQAIQEFVFNINVPTRVGFQSPFFNLTMDLQCPEMFKDKPVMYDGKYQTEVYGQFQKEMNMINKAFCEVMIEGDASGRIFTFPIPTYNIDKTFDWDNEDYDIIFAMAGKHGNPYFANYCGSDMNPEDARSMCPLHGKTKVWVKTAEDGIRRRSLQYVYDKLRDVPIQANYLSSWVDVKIIEVKPELFYKVTLRGGYTTTFESRHEQPVKYAFDDEEQTIIKAKDIKVGMLIPIGKDFGDTNIEYKMVRKVERLLPLENERAFCFEVQGDEAPFFQLANGLVTHNCRLRIDNRELIRRGGGLFGSSPKTGSLNVVTINLARLGYESNSEEDFKRRLDILLEYAKETCVIKRKVINKFTEQGMYPYAAFYLKDTKARTGSCWTNHFNTIGVNGMNEACLNLFGKEFNIGTEKGKQFALNIMNHMRDKLISFQEETNEMFNLEATPAESTAYSLALKDKKIYPDIISASVNEDIPFYTNSTHLPVNFTDDMFELLDLQDELQTKYTGGTVIHIFLGEEVRDPKMVKHMTRKVCENYKLPYFSWTPTFSTCDNHGYLAGEHKDCPHCGGETEVYSRVVGYYRPTRSWNESKQIEFDMRKTFKVD